MTFKEQLQQAADAGHRQRIEDERAVAIEHVAAEQRRQSELAMKIQASMDMLQPLVASMQTAAHRSERMCTAHIVPSSDINLQLAAGAQRPLSATSLRGVSQRLFNLLQEMGLLPILAVTGPDVYEIQVPVLRWSEASSEW